MLKMLVSSVLVIRSSSIITTCNYSSIDKNKCDIEQPCSSTKNEVCEYAVLGYSCVCPPGYERDQNQNCISKHERAILTPYLLIQLHPDIDECVDLSNCPYGNCTDLDPGYTCLCNASFIQVDNTTCLGKLTEYEPNMHVIAVFFRHR